MASHIPLDQLKLASASYRKNLRMISGLANRFQFIWIWQLSSTIPSSITTKSDHLAVIQPGGKEGRILISSNSIVKSSTTSKSHLANTHSIYKTLLRSWSSTISYPTWSASSQTTSQRMMPISTTWPKTIGLRCLHLS